ncbi:type III secretion system chaperone [Endozoicomonas acroporae]|uniref:type III secretion system chaperone n=1 Tax=Endozoicomonas acroporae TaxID=1701104 RepID=UPI000C77A83C|nr:type III secretion system chaperone [Endozoicomonas acroporae]
MSQLEQINQLMIDVGPLTDVHAIVKKKDESGWTLVYEESVWVDFLYSPELQKLTLIAPIGKPGEERQNYTYQTLLEYNWLFETTEGIRIALTEPGGNLMQLLDLFVADLDLSMLRTVVENFTARARRWQAVMMQGGLTAENDDSQESPYADIAPITDGLFKV